MVARLIILLTLLTAAPSGLLAAEPRTSDGINQRGSPVTAGELAPDFTLADQNGRKLTLSAELKARQVVLVFYRGRW